MVEFDLKTKVFFGEDALDHILEKDSKCALVVADPYTITSGLIKEVTNRLEKRGIKYNVCDKVIPDPPMEKVIEGVKDALAIMPDCLIAVGGGSAMDYTKAIKMFGHRVDNNFDPKFVAIPTTSGTGSEVTEVAVVTDTEKQSKIPLVSEELRADEAILDARLVTSVPKNITADTGMDILTHAIEAFVSTNANDFTDALAERALKLCCRYLCRSYLNNEDIEARGKIHLASSMAGMAFNAAGLGLNHGMAHQLGAVFHIPHGRANAMLLPYIISFNSNIQDLTIPKGDEHPKCVQKYCEIAASLGLMNFNEVSTVSSLMNYLKLLSREMDIPSCIEDMKTISKEEYFAAIDKMAEAALNDATTKTNPRVPTKEDIEWIYRDLWDFERTER